MTHLVIMGCSAAKSRQAGLLPAIERYQGPTWVTLRANMRGLPLEVIVLSADYGFIPATSPIAWYDRRLDPDRARDIMLDRSAAWVSERVTRCTGRVFLMGGELYRDTMIAAIGPALVERRRKAGRMFWPVGQGRQAFIGEQMKQLVSFLLEVRASGPLSIDKDIAA